MLKDIVGCCYILKYDANIVVCISYVYPIYVYPIY